MFLSKKNHYEAYLNSYRLLESQLLRLSHSICFDDTQINVYSSELADIINSACIKIESLAKDIYEDHIWPFQEDANVVPPSFTGKNFKPAKWTRDKWKFDYHCLVEIDLKFALSKKRIELKSERFQFLKYGSTIFPFGRIALDDCKGGYWEHKPNSYLMEPERLLPIDWCKSYQAIKHNYIQSIPEHGTVKNAIIVLGAFYLLSLYYCCLPSRQFDIDDRNSMEQLDFGSELFSCGMCNFTVPPCIIDSEKIRRETYKAQSTDAAYQEAMWEFNLLHDIDGFPFLVTLNDDTCHIVYRMVEQYCKPRNLSHFDIAPYLPHNNRGKMDAGSLLYTNLKQYINAPHQKSHVCISFNVGTKQIYENVDMELFDYEISKHKNRTASLLAELKVGDIVDVEYIFDEIIKNGEVVEIGEGSISVAVADSTARVITSYPNENIVSIRKVCH